MAAAGRPKVLVIRGGAIGDFILTLPAIKLLRENIPNAHLEILGYQPIVELAVKAGLADATRSLEHGTMAKLFVPGATIDEGLVAYFKSFNLVVSYLYDPDGILRANMESMGVKTYLEASHRVTAGHGHATEQLARPLERLAMYLEDSATTLIIASAEGQSQPQVVIHPGSGSVQKTWPLERWLEIGNRITANFPQVQLVMVTGEAEQERGITEQMLSGWEHLDIEHWDQLALPELAGCLSHATAFIGHDSGVSHLAAACGLPSFLLFGPTDPAIWAPRQPKVEVHQEPSGNLGHLSPDLVWPAMSVFLEGALDKRSVSSL